MNETLSTITCGNPSWRLRNFRCMKLQLNIHFRRNSVIMNHIFVVNHHPSIHFNSIIVRLLTGAFPTQKSQRIFNNTTIWQTCVILHRTNHITKNNTQHLILANSNSIIIYILLHKRNHDRKLIKIGEKCQCIQFTTLVFLEMSIVIN